MKQNNKHNKQKRDTMTVEIANPTRTVHTPTRIISTGGTRRL